jgi:hypothetical protein
MWERDQEKKTKVCYGAQDRPEDKYELLLDNQVEYVQAKVLEGIIKQVNKKDDSSSSSNSDSEEVIDEAKLREAEKNLTP